MLFNGNAGFSPESIFKICSQRDLESAPDFIEFFGRNEFEEDAIYGNRRILCLKGSNVFGRHTNNETTNRFGWGNTAKAQKVETSIEVRIVHQAVLVQILLSVCFCRANDLPDFRPPRPWSTFPERWFLFRLLIISKVLAF